MSESTITAKGQTTVPRQVRELIGAGPGTRLVWHVMPGGGVSVRAKTRSVPDEYDREPGNEPAGCSRPLGGAA